MTPALLYLYLGPKKAEEASLYTFVTTLCFVERRPFLSLSDYLGRRRKKNAFPMPCHMETDSGQGIL